jgi:hypothetical protein
MFSFQAVSCNLQPLVNEGKWFVGVSTATREILEDPNQRSRIYFCTNLLLVKYVVEVSDSLPRYPSITSPGRCPLPIDVRFSTHVTKHVRRVFQVQSG